MEEEKSYTESFATIYDDVMSGVPYDLWYKYLSELLAYYNKQPHTILDLACGTGNMSIRFAREKNVRVVGIDKSREMLKVAARKIEREDLAVEFIREDLRKFNLSQSFDFAFSVFDSLNYILRLEDLKKVFCNVYKVLKNRGIFIFDMNTERRLKSIEPGTTMFSGDNYTCFWEDIVDKKKVRWRVKLKIYLGDDSDCFEEIHEETSYPRDSIIEALKQAGFTGVKVYRAFTFNEGNDRDNRLYFVVFKGSPDYEEASFFRRIKKKVKWKLLSSCY